MKKLKLDFGAIQGDILSKEELKKIMGGDFGSDDGDAETACKGKAEEGCLTSISCTVDCGGYPSNGGNCKWSTSKSKCYCTAICI